jgi:hypothetical protein
MKTEFDIAVLLPTRARTESLFRSVRTLFELAKHPEKIQINFAFDNNDQVGLDYFQQQVEPWLTDHDIEFTAFSFEPRGYIRLNEYVNKMAESTSADWFIVWNDDAVMQTQDWDQEIVKYQGQFKLLAFRTHRDHPYSIFPIVPKAWYDLLGYISPHQLSDAWTSQTAYMLDIFQRIEVHVLHDRHDLTGNNGDITYQNRPMLEGNPNDPRDFHSMKMNNLRLQDCARLNNYMKSQGLDGSFFENVFAGTQDPWVKLKENDTNRQMVQYVTRQLISG